MSGTAPGTSGALEAGGFFLFPDADPPVSAFLSPPPCPDFQAKWEVRDALWTHGRR